MNRIIKTTMELLLRSDISKSRKKSCVRYWSFSEVEPLDVYRINWGVEYNRNNQSYRMLISICYLVVKGLYKLKLMDLRGLWTSWMNKGCIGYMRNSFWSITGRASGDFRNASQIPWQLGDDMSAMLPVMQTDIMLTKGEKTLIIDAKYYAHSTQVQYDRYTLHSGNMYQIFTYVKNKDAELAGKPHTVSGMLLYAKTDEDIFPDHEYSMSGNKIAVRTLDLSGNFDSIRNQLDGITSRFFEESA